MHFKIKLFEKKAEEKKENTQKTLKKTVTSKKKVMPKRK